MDMGLQFQRVVRHGIGLINCNIADSLSAAGKSTITSASIHMTCGNIGFGPTVMDDTTGPITDGLLIIAASHAALDEFHGVTGEDGCFAYSDLSEATAWSVDLTTIGSIADAGNASQLFIPASDLTTGDTFEIELSEDMIAAMQEWLDGDEDEAGFILSTRFGSSYASLTNIYHHNEATTAYRPWIEVVAE